jgi:hypothetical protein
MVSGTVHAALVRHALQLLPSPLVRVLDAWSHRVAQRRFRERQQRWLQRNAAPAAPAPVKYHLKPWRD